MDPLYPENETLLEEFIRNLAMEKEGNTAKMYRADLHRFLTWLQAKEVTLQNISQQDIIQFRDEMVVRGKKATTINKWISEISSFFNWATGRDYVKRNVAEQLRILDGKKEKPRWLSSEEEQRLLEAAQRERNPFKKARNEALIYTMLFAGLRIEEISALQLHSIEQGNLIVFEKRSEKRRVPMPSNLQIKLLEWLKFRSQSPKKIHKESPYLFVTERSGQMQPRSIQFVMEGYSKKIGISITSHMLRHTFCRRQVEKGNPIEQVQQWAGHKWIQSTILYADD